MVENAACWSMRCSPSSRCHNRVLSFPYPLRFLFASRPAIMGQVLGIVYRDDHPAT